MAVRGFRLILLTDKQACKQAVTQTLMIVLALCNWHR